MRVAQWVRPINCFKLLDFAVTKNFSNEFLGLLFQFFNFVLHVMELLQDFQHECHF
jgi:hypothetical protein